MALRLPLRRLGAATTTAAASSSSPSSFLHPAAARWPAFGGGAGGGSALTAAPIAATTCCARAAGWRMFASQAEAAAVAPAAEPEHVAVAPATEAEPEEAAASAAQMEAPTGALETPETSGISEAQGDSSATPAAMPTTSAPAGPSPGGTSSFPPVEPGPPGPVTHPDALPDSETAHEYRRYERFMVATYARPPVIFVSGRGSYMFDMEGRRYLDFTSGIAVTALGHADKEIKSHLRTQAKLLWHSSNLYYHNKIGKLSMKLVLETNASNGMGKRAHAAFICNSGSEANEAAIKFARKVGHLADPSGAKHEIVCFSGAFHGRTMGSLSATPKERYQAPFKPMVPGFRVGRYNSTHGLEELITERTCGVIVEPVQGEAGVIVGHETFLAAVAKRTREVGAVLIHDEIQCGLSRTGRLWAHSALGFNCHPDMVTTAKALGNGFPIGAVIVNDRVAKAIRIGDHGTTFGGNPLACAVADMVLGRLTSMKIKDNVGTQGQRLLEGLTALKARFPQLITEIRGLGLMLGVQLTEDPAAIVKAARERGLLIITAGKDTLRLVPNLKIDGREVQEGLKILGDAIAVTRP